MIQAIYIKWTILRHGFNFCIFSIEDLNCWIISDLNIAVWCYSQGLFPLLRLDKIITSLLCANETQNFYFPVWYRHNFNNCCIDEHIKSFSPSCAKDRGGKTECMWQNYSTNQVYHQFDSQTYQKCLLLYCQIHLCFDQNYQIHQNYQSFIYLYTQVPIQDNKI